MLRDLNCGQKKKYVKLHSKYKIPRIENQEFTANMPPLPNNNGGQNAQNKFKVRISKIHELDDGLIDQSSDISPNS